MNEMHRQRPAITYGVPQGSILGPVLLLFFFFSCKLQSTIIHYTQTSPCYDANELDHRKLHSLIFVVALAHREKNSNAPLLF